MTDQQNTPTADDARAQTIVGIRALADFLDTHPGVPVGNVLAFGPYHYGSDGRDKAIADLTAHAEAVGDAGALGTNYSGDPCLAVTFGKDVRWEESWPRDSVCTPRVEDGKVVWDLPVLATVASEA